MTRRLILLAVAAAVIGGLGFWVYDRYLGGELRQGEHLRDALAEELAAAGFAFASMEYDWRARRVVAEGLAATELPEGITGLSIGKATYRGAEPAAIRAAFEKPKSAAKGKSEPSELIADLTLSDIYIGFEGGAEFRQASLTLKHVSLGTTAAPKEGAKAVLGSSWAHAADLARRFHVRLLQAEDARFWHPETQATYEQKLLRLEDYRGGNFSEFRLEGLSLAVAVVFQARLDEFFAQSVKARKFLARFHRTPLFDMTAQLTGGERPGTFATPAEAAIVAGDWALIGFEARIPAAGRIAFEEITGFDRQFVNGVELGGKSKVVALELQFSMLTKVLAAGLDTMGINLAAAAAEAGSDAEAWLAARAANSAAADGAMEAALQPESGAEGSDAPRPQAPKAKPRGTPHAPPAGNDQIPMGPHDGEVTQGPAAPVPEVWGNEIEAPKAQPEIDEKKIAEIIRKLGFDHMHIDGESAAAFDRRRGVWELSKFVFNLERSWNLAVDLRLGGMGALEELGHVPPGPDGWWQGPGANAVGERLMDEGQFESFSLTYREQGFLSRLMSLIAEQQGTTVEKLATEAAAGLLSGENGVPLLQAEGLAEAVKAFLISPERLAIRLQPEEPVPFEAVPAGSPLPELLTHLGLELTLNGQSFADFKKTAPIASDMAGEQD